MSESDVTRFGPDYYGRPCDVCSKNTTNRVESNPVCGGCVEWIAELSKEESDDQNTNQVCYRR